MECRFGGAKAARLAFPGPVLEGDELESERGLVKNLVDPAKAIKLPIPTIERIIMTRIDLTRVQFSMFSRGRKGFLG